MYRPVNYWYNNCINTSYSLTNDDYNSILKYNGFGRCLPTTFDVAEAYSRDHLVIYKLSFKKLDDGNNSSDSEKCIYFTLLWKEDRLVISCFNRVETVLKSYKYINVAFSCKLSDNKLDIDCLDDDRNSIGKIDIDFEDDKCTISTLSKIIELLIPCDGDYYEDSAFKCEVDSVLSTANVLKSFVSIYSNYSIVTGNKDTIDNFQNVIGSNFSKYIYVCYEFRITILYNGYEYVVDLGYIVYPNDYKNGVTTFEKGGYIRNGIFNTQVLDKDLVTIADNKIKTIDFEMDAKEKNYTNLTKDRCYKLMPNHNYNYPYSRY